MAYSAGIGVFGDRVQAVVFDLPGCTVGASTLNEALAALPLAIAEHLSWIESWGEAVPAGAIEFKIAETMDAAASGAADGEFTFAHDREAPEDGEVERAMRVLAHSRDDLLATIRHLRDEVLDSVPAETAIGQIDEWAPGVRSIREIIAHITSGDSYYASGVTELPPLSAPPTLDGERRRAVAALRALSRADGARLFRVRRGWQERGEEEWTLRKTLRRMISHERFHTAEIRQRLAWLLVGEPNVRG
jgi:hypothetical protein